MTSPEIRARARSERLMHYYSAERRAGTTPLEAHERMHEFAKRLDALEYEADLQVIKECMERVS